MQLANSESYLLVSASSLVKRSMILLLLTLFCAVGAQAQVDVFMRITGSKDDHLPPGESNDPVYSGADGWFRIRSFSFGIDAGYDPSRGTANTATKASGIALDVGKELGLISPSIFSTTALGKSFEKLEIVVRKSGARDGVGYLLYEFGKAFPLNQRWAGNEDQASETIRFGYGAFRLTYRPQAPNGELGAPIVKAWSFETNRDEFTVLTH